MSPREYGLFQILL